MATEYPNVVDFLCDHGHEYAGGVVSGRIDKIKDAVARYLAEANEEPLDCQEQDKQTERFGIVIGLEKALTILGVETEEP